MARFYLTLACCLLFVAGAYSACFQARMSCTPGEPFYGAIRGTSTKCYDCSCNSRGNLVGCCLNIPAPAGYDRVKCKATFDDKTCRYKVTRLKNSKKKCPVSAWVG